MKIKTFTVKEANKLVPKIKSAFDDIFILKKKVVILKNEMDWLSEFWKENLHDIDNPDSGRHERLEYEAEKLQGRITRKINNLQCMGCIVKDADAGLVDFYSVINNDVVFLCWKYGEKEITYWHSVEGGFRGRQALKKMDGIDE